MLNLANPAAAFRWWRLPADGVGLARMEFVVSNHIKVHPMALVHYDTLKDEDAKRTIAELDRRATPTRPNTSSTASPAASPGSPPRTIRSPSSCA